MKELQLQANINNLMLESGFCKKEKESIQATLSEQKQANKDLKEKLKSLNQEKSSMQALEGGNEKEKAALSDEIEKLKAEIAEKDSAMIEHELNVQRLEAELAKQKKLLADTVASGKDTDALLEQIKSLHKELIEGKEQYEQQLNKTEQEKAQQEKQIAQLLSEKAKQDKNVGDDSARIKVELMQAKEVIIKFEEQIRSQEIQISNMKKAEYNSEDKQVKELLNKVKEDNARLKEELNNKAADLKEIESHVEELKVKFD